MPTIEENKAKWDGSYHWREMGDRWSEPWGNPEMQWHASILPRIHAFLPAKRILEIAPGFGRWTAHLKDHCEELVIVDLSEKCIEACKNRFSQNERDASRITYHVNDGRSLEMVPDDSIDFVFSYDSMVHVERDVIEAYLAQIAKKLTRDGVCFIHHSNAGKYAAYFKLVRAILPLKIIFRLFGLETKTHGRALSVDANSFRAVAEAAGLRCITQELINWQSPLLIDCHSVVVRSDSQWGSGYKRWENSSFMKEARHIRRMAPLYSKLEASSSAGSDSGPV